MKAQQLRIVRLFVRVRSQVYPTPADCLRRLARMHPHLLAQVDAVRWAQQCLEQAKTVIGRRACCRIFSPGDEQAIDIYENAVAVGFYRMEQQNVPVSMQPTAGSDWSEAQLLRIRRIGVEHGRLIRIDAFGPDVPLSTE
ncbi:hypothetical protein [Pandoraea sputorum]|uniref:hypothetical protein n=1 Tax=Pandoraea sputorum TaxID=93222 RepID=UPI0012423C80|nr:hypothetical protein [Pandoraea sputorum]VVE82972.1 hypothetical protein PSP31120_03903 [Pandoraea sputorum]